MPDLIEIITDDHETLDDLLSRIEELGRSGPADDHREAVEALVQEARRHSIAERDVVVPALVHRLADGPERAAQTTGLHDQIDELVGDLRSTSSDDPGYFALVTRLVERLREHLGTADQALLPDLGESLTTEDREELGEAYARAREATDQGTGPTPGSA